MTTLRMIPGITYTRKNLEALTGMPDRANRHVIRAQRRQGVPIVALPDGGYKLAETDEEKKMLLAMYRKRALDELATYSMLAKAMQVPGQMTVEELLDGLAVQYDNLHARKPGQVRASGCRFGIYHRAGQHLRR